MKTARRGNIESELSSDMDEPQPLPESLELPVIQTCECRVIEDARSRWTDSGYVALKHISCRCDDGVLVIDGTVPSYYFKQMAQELARSVEGIHRIENRLIVADAAGSKSREDHSTNDASNE